MADEAVGPPMVVLPERVDRRLRLGPFPSARDALKFLGYAAVGSLVALALSPWIGVGTIVLGFGVAIARVDGQSPDRRALAYLRYRVGRPRRSAPVNRGPVSALARRGFVALADGRYAAMVRAGGTPMAYLPPADLAARFDRFREMLRSNVGDLILAGSLAPMRAGPVMPPPVARERMDHDAHGGYSSLIRMICHRRRVRRVDLLLASDEGGPVGIERLEVRTGSVIERLAALEVPAQRLRGRALRDAVERVAGPGG